MPRWLSNPGTFGYGKPVFIKAYDSSPVLAQNIAEARKLVKQAGATGKTLTIGTTSQLAVYAGDTGAWQAAAQAIGLKVVLKSVPAQNYINFFTDPKARAGIDGLPAVTYGDYADPAALLNQIVLPGGVLNLDGFNDPAITAALEQARSTASPAKRAALGQGREADDAAAPWIPTSSRIPCSCSLKASPARFPRPPTCTPPGPTAWAGPAHHQVGSLCSLRHVYIRPVTTDSVVT